MGLKVMNDNNVNIFAKEDAGHYYALSGYMKHYISKEYGDKFNVTLNGLVAKLSSGQGSIYGRHVINDGSAAVECVLPPNASGYIVLTLDLTKTFGNEMTFATKTILEVEDIVNGGLKYDLPLFRYTTNLTSVTTLSDVREYKSNIITKDKLDNNVIDLIVPVGIVREFGLDKNPNTIYPGTTWERFAEGRTTVGLKSGDTDFGAIGRVGGDKTVTLTKLQMPVHGHYLNGFTFSWGDGLGDVNIQNAVAATGSTSGNRLYTNHGQWGVTRENGGNQAHDNLQPYIVVSKWIRTA